MKGPDNKPLLVLVARGRRPRGAAACPIRSGCGRAAFEGGGPHLDLLRRLSHWLMKEPDLEEEALRLMVSGHQPRGAAADHGRRRRRRDAHVAFGRDAHAQARRRPSPGVWQSTITASELGLWRATDGKLNALVNIGPANPREFAEVTSTTDVLAPIAKATGGDVAPAR